MRINVYSQELTNEVIAIRKESAHDPVRKKLNAAEARAEQRNSTLGELERLHAASTPGPWRAEREPDVSNDWFDRHTKDGATPIESTGTVWALGQAVGCSAERHDAALIVALHNAFPALLEYVRALEEVAEAASRALHDANGSHAEDCNAYGADDEEVQSDPQSPDPYCDCGAIESRMGLRAALARLAALRGEKEGA